MRSFLFIIFILMGGYFLINSAKANMPPDISGLLVFSGGLAFLFGFGGILAKSLHFFIKRRKIKKQQGYIEKRSGIYLKNTPRELT